MRRSNISSSASGSTSIDTDQRSPRTRKSGRSGYSRLMMGCCIPMLVIAIALVASGIASFGFLFVAITCTGMMAIMMRGMSSSGGDQKP